MRLKGRVALGAMFGSLWFASLATMPYLLSQAVDRGLRPRDPATLIAWTAAVLLVGTASAVLGILRHRSMSKLRLEAALRAADSVMAHATRLGAALPRRVTAGEVVTIGIADVWTIGRAMNVGGIGVASTFAYAVVAFLLFRISPLLAVVVLAGVPVLALGVGPLLGRVQSAGARYRERQGRLAGRLVDVVDGLRILNGLGGKDAHLARYRGESATLLAEGYRVGAAASWIGALGDGSYTIPMRCARGTISTRSSSHFEAISSNSKAMPVRLPAGRPRFARNPKVLETPTIGIDWIAARAASTAAADATMRSLAPRESATASSGNRSGLPSA